MKFSVVALLPALCLAATIEKNEAQRLPTVEGDVSSHAQDAAEAQPAARTSYAAQSAQLCQAGYPFYCDGYCCPYNSCCARECCGPRATFCGADGLCYI